MLAFKKVSDNYNKPTCTILKISLRVCVVKGYIRNESHKQVDAIQNDVNIVTMALIR